MKYIIIILFFSQCLFAQQINEVPVVDQNVLDISDANTMKSYGIETFDNRHKGIEGSVFHSDDWGTGKIKIANAKVYDQYTFKYNLLDQNLIIKVEDRFFALPGMFVESFELKSNYDSPRFNSRKFVRKVNPDQSIYFLEVIVEGKCTLYKKNEVRMIKANYNPALNTGEINDRLDRIETYFFSFDESLVEIPSKKKKLIKSVPNQTSLIKLLNESDYDLSNEASLTELTIKLNATNIN